MRDRFTSHDDNGRHGGKPMGASRRALHAIAAALDENGIPTASRRDGRGRDGHC
jgi:hypothetical protein